MIRKYGLVDVINEVSAEVAKALGVDISERGILVVRVIPYFAVGGKIKIQGNVLGHITNDQGFEDRYELVANEEYEILLEDKKEKGLLSNKVMVAKGGEKSLLLTPFNDRVMMSYGFASFSPLKQEEKQSGGAGFVDVSYFLFPRKWSFDYMMGIASVETPLIELFLGTGWYQTLLKERLYVRARFLTGIGVMGGETSWNTMVMGGVMIKWNHLVIGGDIGVGYNMPSYFLSDHWYDRFHGWIGFYF
ncbi:MAG: hypothetical protein N2314_02220 [Brevinematales bacterium]|nr:hypothetical protein [Brevinematales bacterium]